MAHRPRGARPHDRAERMKHSAPVPSAHGGSPGQESSRAKATAARISFRAGPGNLPRRRSSLTRGSDEIPCTLATDASRRKLIEGSTTSYWLPRYCVVSGTKMTSALGASSSCLDTMTTGLVLAAIPRSASQTSPGYRLIQKVKDFLFDCAGPQELEGACICEIHDLGHQGFHPSRNRGLPLIELVRELLNQGGHAPRIHWLL